MLPMEEALLAPLGYFPKRMEGAAQIDSFPPAL